MSFRYIEVRKTIQHTVTAQEILDRLERYIEENDDRPIKLLVSHWKDQENAISYGEIKDAILNGSDGEEFMKEWTDDYTRFVRDKLTKVWTDAEMAGSYGQPMMDSIRQQLTFDMNSSTMQEWISERGGSFITSVTEQQQEAVRSLLRQAVYEKYSPDELSKLIRPCVGLTEPQSRAVLRYYDTLKSTMREQHPRMLQSNLEERCRSKAMSYAGRLHRDRAKMIAQTEMSFAYNHGMHESTRQAMQQGLIGTVEKRWVTSTNENVCPVCEALNGTQIGFDASFDFGKHRHLFDGQEECPPAHPRCACVVEYIEVAPPKF